MKVYCRNTCLICHSADPLSSSVQGNRKSLREGYADLNEQVRPFVTTENTKVEPARVPVPHHRAGKTKFKVQVIGKKWRMAADRIKSR
jgi:hypothetical protein